MNALPIAGMPTALYRLLDAGGTLLYVGITDNVAHRLRQHARSKPDWPLVASVAVDMHPDRASAAAAEVRAIKDEAPAWNVVGVARPRTTRQQVGVAYWATTDLRQLIDDLGLNIRLPQNLEDARARSNAVRMIRKVSGL